MRPQCHASSCKCEKKMYSKKYLAARYLFQEIVSSIVRNRFLAQVFLALSISIGGVGLASPGVQKEQCKLTLFFSLPSPECILDQRRRPDSRELSGYLGVSPQPSAFFVHLLNNKEYAESNSLIGSSTTNRQITYVCGDIEMKPSIAT